MAVKRTKVKTGQTVVDRQFLNKMVDALVKETGQGVTQLLGSDGLTIRIRGVLSTQCPTLDAAIGRGGIPFARLTIINGPESSGKTTLALHLAAECQRSGGIVLYMDKEYKLDPDYAASIGVDIQNLIISQPPYLEKVFSTIEKAVEVARMHRLATKQSVPILVILDSMNAAISKAAFEGDWDAQQMADVARIYSSKLPKLMPVVNQQNVALVFISQIREKIGVIFGDKEDIAGGHAPKHYASVILDVRKIGVIKDGEDIIGNHVRAFVKKNQIAPPFRKAEFDIFYAKGIDYHGALLARALKLEIVQQSGSWYSYGDERLGQGTTNVSEFLIQHANITEQIRKDVDEHGYGK